jgi:hypothetical protein
MKPPRAAREQQRRVDPRREAVQRGARAPRQRDTPAAGLRVRRHGAVGHAPLHEDRAAVDVAALERGPLVRPQPVSAAKMTSGPYTGPSSAASASISARVNGRSSSVRGAGFGPAPRPDCARCSASGPRRRGTAAARASAGSASPPAWRPSGRRRRRRPPGRAAARRRRRRGPAPGQCSSKHGSRSPGRPFFRHSAISPTPVEPDPGLDSAALATCAACRAPSG